MLKAGRWYRSKTRHDAFRLIVKVTRTHIHSIFYYGDYNRPGKNGGLDILLKASPGWADFKEWNDKQEWPAYIREVLGYTGRPIR